MNSNLRYNSGNDPFIERSPSRVKAVGKWHQAQKSNLPRAGSNAVMLSAALNLLLSFPPTFQLTIASYGQLTPTSNSKPIRKCWITTDPKTGSLVWSFETEGIIRRTYPNEVIGTWATDHLAHLKLRNLITKETMLLFH